MKTGFFSLFIIAVLFTISLSLAGQNHKTKPNIVLILADDLGWGDLHINGNLHAFTPVLDKLANESLSFDRFYVCPLCAPTRAELLTGRYFLRTGVSSVSNGYENMNPNETTIAEVLKKNGYSTGCFGKWHNGANFLQHPNRQGFDEYIGFMMGHLGYYYNTIYRHNDVEINSTGYSTDFFTEKALSFIDQNKQKPFFCFVSYNVPHSPFQVPAKYYEKYKKRGLDSVLASVYGMNENMDENIGLILNKLEEKNIRKNTIVIFLSDNGPNTPRFNGEMKGRKGSVDEGGTRVPFYISWPGSIKPGTTAQLAMGVDFLPTIVRLCNLNFKPVLPLDGKDLSKIIRKQTEPFDRYIFSRQASFPLKGLAGSVRNNKYRLVVNQNDTAIFDMQNDPSQKSNLAKQLPNETAKLTTIYSNWEKELISNYKPNTVIEAGFKNEKQVVLLVQDAILSGKVKRSSIHPNQSHTENWVQPGDSIFWILSMVKHGKYQVELKYGCDYQNTGSSFLFTSKSDSFSFFINKPFNSEILPNLDYVPRTESVERTWDWMPVGKIRLKKGTEKLTIKLQHISNKEAGFIKAIRLIKV